MTGNNLMSSFYAAFAIFIEHPWLGAVAGVAFYVLFRLRRGRGALVASVLWLLYSAYEYGMKLRILCSGECNIRIDLLVIYPVLLLLSVFALVAMLRPAAR